MFSLIFFIINRRLQAVLDGKSTQEYPINAGVFLLHIKYLSDVICNIAIYADDDTTLYCKCDQASDLWQQLELAFELESGIRDTADLGRK